MERQRIPAAASGDFLTWALPDVSEGAIVEAEARRQPRETEPEASVPTVTAAELEAITQQAWQEGRDQGYRDGHAEGVAAGHTEGLAAGRAAARVELEREVAGLKAIAAQLLEPIDGQREAIEAALLRLSLDIARAVLDAEPALPPERLLPVVREAVQQLPVGERNFRVLLHPDQAALVRDCAGWPAHWPVAADAAVEPGGCRVESDYALVDHTRGLRFRQVAARLLGEQNSVPEPGLLLDAADDA